MKYSEDALKKFSAISGKDECFWKNTFANWDDEYGLVVYGEDDYPFIIDGNGNLIPLKYTTKRNEHGTRVPNRRGAPHLLLYKGDITLLNKQNFTKNIAVIGLLNPTGDIIKREKLFVKKIVNNGGNIVSGLALGCDLVAHRTCLENGGKTIAILPSRLDKILPKENRELANEIVEKGGLLITEYYNDPIERFELSARYIERDRLQAYFSSSIILTASYRHPDKNGKLYPSDGIKRDSGSRHAMKIAKDIGRGRYVLFDKKIDFNSELFDLNKDLLSDEKDPAKILTDSVIKNIVNCDLPGTLPLFR